MNLQVGLLDYFSFIDLIVGWGFLACFWQIDWCFFSLVRHIIHPIRNAKVAKGNMQSAVSLFRLGMFSLLEFGYYKVC